MASLATAKMMQGVTQRVLPKAMVANIIHNNNWQTQLKIILNQQRDVLNFQEYAVSEEHMNRMQQLAESVPEVFNNPSSTHRSKWFDHPNYHRNIQMPKFHVHFRQEMQSVLSHLDKAHDQVLLARFNDCKSSTFQFQNCKSAYLQFQNFVGGLNGHFSMEEYAWFPVFQKHYPEIDLEFLYEDHGHLHQKKGKVLQALQDLMDASCSRRRQQQQEEVVEQQEELEEQVVSCIQLTMDFDQQLMGHLGEEEEILMPMSLAYSKRLPL
mmetsp:Transcript_57/g.93  ORF Transcript_57/g.93 Transcript_57/m.93 type:complete len:267 (-) Transcript_57:121-921(-)